MAILISDKISSQKTSKIIPPEREEGRRAPALSGTVACGSEKVPRPENSDRHGVKNYLLL